MHQGTDRRSSARRFLGGAWRLAGAAALMLALAGAPALAVHPGHWVHNSEADYDAGTTHDTIVTNLGDVKLAAQTQTLAKMPEEAGVIYDLRALANGDLYIAAGPEGKILRRRGEKIEQVVALKGEQVFSLNVLPDGKLLVAVSSSDKSRLAYLDGDKLVDLVSLPGVRYVWDMAVRGNTIYLVGGTKGKLMKVDLAAKDDKGQPKVTTLLQASQANLLCLAIDKDGRIFAGSDTDGLVYRVTVDANGKADSYVVFNASEPEIGAILAADDGTVYVGTADADQARPGRLEAASNAESGRLEAPAVKPPEAKPPANPIPNPPPKPNPTQTPKPDAHGAAAPPDAGPPTDDAEETGQTAPAKKPAAAPQAVTDHPAPTPLADAAPAGGDQQQNGDQGSPVTPEQRDQLRQIIRQRLEQARRTGEFQVAGPGNGPGRRVRPNAAGPNGPPQGGARPAAPGAKQGNAIYRISPDGMVTEVFRESMMVLRMAQFNGKLLVATGNEGHVYSIDPAADENAILVDLEAQQASALLVGADGQVLLGTSNPATLVQLNPGTAKEGTFTSVVLDAGQISLWGKLDVTGSIPKGSKLTVETRAGNVQDPEKAPWSNWQEAGVLAPDDNAHALAPMQTTIASPPGRFLQYRLTFTHEGVGTPSPTVHRVEVTFVVPNLKPVISSIQAVYPGLPPPTPSGNPASPAPMQRAGPPRAMGPAAAGGGEAGPANVLNVDWEASDPNNDQLVYTLEYKPAGGDHWLPLAKDLKDTHYEWQTRRVPDGRYIVRVTASDLPDNTPEMALTASRDSDPVLINNTPPVLDFQVKPGNAKGQADLSGTATDALSMIQAIHYAVDSTEHWQYILPKNLIYDSTTEAFEVTIPDLTPGQHVVTVRATDAQGNAQYKAIMVEVK